MRGKRKDQPQSKDPYPASMPPAQQGILIATTGAVPTLTLRHPDRSRFSGGAKDLLLHGPILSVAAIFRQSTTVDALRPVWYKWLNEDLLAIVLDKECCTRCLTTVPPRM